MRQQQFAAALIALFSFCVMAPLHAEEVFINNSDGSATYTWNPDAVISGENHLGTSNPSTFTGADVANLIGANTFYTNGYNGAGTIALNIEAGHVWNGHESLTHVSTLTNAPGVPSAPFGSPAFDRHATWVGMMIGGRQTVGGDVFQEGIAYGTDLRSGAIATGWNGSAYALSFSATLGSLAHPYVTGGFGTANVINSSWGATGAANSPEAGGTDVRAMIVDSLANQNRLTTMVVSAGNDGPGANTVGSPGSGYNAITVGALQNVGNVYNTVASFSSRGPQDYRDSNGTVPTVRAAVDIVAPGTTLTSAYYGGQTGGNDVALAGSAISGGPNFYSGGLGGTSFASPITAGAVTLMHDAALDRSLGVDARDSRVIKANLLNGAAKITGWTNGQVAHPNANGGVRTSQSLDFNSGAGAVDMDRTYTQYLLGQTDINGTSGGSTAQTIGWDYGTVAVGGQTDVVITTPLVGGSEFRATLSWFRERTYTNSSTQTDVGFANLNLEIWDSTFTTLYSDSISLYNAVEHLNFILPDTGTYGIRVAYPNNIFGSLASEEFGVAWWGVAVPEPSTFALTIVGLIALASIRRRAAR